MRRLYREVILCQREAGKDDRPFRFALYAVDPNKNGFPGAQGALMVLAICGRTKAAWAADRSFLECEPNCVELEMEVAGPKMVVSVHPRWTGT